jgi:hypothetical protein
MCPYTILRSIVLQSLLAVPARAWQSIQSARTRQRAHLDCAISIVVVFASHSAHTRHIAYSLTSHALRQRGLAVAIGEERPARVRLHARQRLLAISEIHVAHAFAVVGVGGARLRCRSSRCRCVILANARTQSVTH